MKIFTFGYALLSMIMMLFPTMVSAQSLSKPTVEPASGTTLHSIKSIDVWFGISIDKIDISKAFITNTATNEVIKCTSFTLNYTDYTRFMQGGSLTFPEITADGEYKFTLEAGAVTPWESGNGTNALVEATYIVNSSVEELTYLNQYNISPGSEEPVANISTILLTFPKAAYSDPIEKNGEKWKEITLTCGDKVYYCIDLDGSYGSYSLVFNEDASASAGQKITTPGVYALTIPAGVLNNGVDLVTDPTAKYFETPEILHKITVSDDIDFNYNCTPASGSSNPLPKMGQISLRITFPSGVNSISLTPKVDGTSISITLNGNPIPEVDNPATENGYSLTAYSSSLNFTVSKALITEPSEIRITAPKGAFTVEDLASPAIDYAVTYNPPKEFTFTTTPEADKTVKEASVIVVSFTNATTIDKPYYCWDDLATLTSANGNTTLKSKNITVDASGEHPTATFNFGENIPDGEWTFNFAKDNLTLDGEANPAINFTFVVDSTYDDPSLGVENICTGNASVTSSANEIIISNPDGLSSIVINTMGQIIYSGNEDKVNIKADRGIYLVRIGKNAIKILVK